MKKRKHNKYKRSAFFIALGITALILCLPVVLIVLNHNKQPHDTPTYATGSIPPPPGYANLIFDDQFQGSTLDTTKWNVQMGDAQYWPWGDNGKLPYPYSAVQNDNAQPMYNAEYGNPDQITVNNGLTLGAVRDTTTTHPGFADYGYTWKAGYVTTEHHFSFQGGYVQIKAQLPDSSSGEWAGFWFHDGGSELDLDESGYTGCGATAVNRCMAMHVQTTGNNQVLVDTGVDLSAGYHIYGMKYIPGQSITMYLDGRQLYQTTTNIPTGAYEIIMANTIATANTSGWHTLTSSATPQPLNFKIAEVQVWEPGIVTPTATSVPTNTPTPLPTNTPIPTPTPTPVPVNIVQNPSFENTGTNWLSPWTFSVQTGANGSISQGTMAESGLYSAKLTISKTNTNAWYVQLAQGNLPFTAGRTYTISFWAQAAKARTLEWGLQQNHIPYTWNVFQTVNLITTWQQFTATYTPTVSDTNLRLNFDVANASPTVRIDNVSIK